MLWTINHTLKSTTPAVRRDELLGSVLNARGFNTPAAIKDFLQPPSPLTLTPSAIGLNSAKLKKAIARIRSAIAHHSLIIIYGDYDADGITATAILWETLHALGANARPFIPARDRHGYGLSIAGLKEALSAHQPLTRSGAHALVITVDNGITAYEAAEWLTGQGIDLIITDHHQPSDHLPPHFALVHTDQVSGAGVAWFLAKELVRLLPGSDENLPAGRQGASLVSPGVKNVPSQTLDLVTIGTVADMLPLIGVNRSLVYHGLQSLKTTPRPGLKALLDQAGIPPDTDLTTYHINFVIAPRLNAMGRLEHALDSLRLLCTHSQAKGLELASRLTQTNVSRQDLTQILVDQAIALVEDKQAPILVIAHADFHEGVIGLVAGKLAEKYYRPAIVISVGVTQSKASARSIKGVNIIDLIRRHQDLLLNAGGHPMAAGFSLKSEAIEAFIQAISRTAAQTIDPALFTRRLKVDCQIELADLNQDTYQAIQTLKPFGIGNPEPVLALSGIRPFGMRLVGAAQNHLRLTLPLPSGKPLTAIGFGLGSPSASNLPGGDQNRQGLVSPGVNIHPGDLVDLAFTLSQNTWNGTTSLQLLLKDLRPATLLG